MRVKMSVEEMSDDEGVDLFAAAMKRRMARAAKNVRRGWNHPTSLSAEYLVQLLMDEITSDDGEPHPVDIANYAMMIYHRGAAGRLALREACKQMLAAMGED